MFGRTGARAPPNFTPWGRQEIPYITTAPHPLISNTSRLGSSALHSLYCTYNIKQEFWDNESATTGRTILSYKFWQICYIAVDHTTNLSHRVYRTYRLHDRLPPYAKRSMTKTKYRFLKFKIDQGYGRGGTPIFTGVFEPLARVALYPTD